MQRSYKHAGHLHLSQRGLIHLIQVRRLKRSQGKNLARREVVVYMSVQMFSVKMTALRCLPSSTLTRLLLPPFVASKHNLKLVQGRHLQSC